jgi:hypothetical protein
VLTRCSVFNGRNASLHSGLPIRQHFGEKLFTLLLQLVATRLRVVGCALQLLTLP